MASDKKDEIDKYKKAAKRHLDTCRYMLDHLDKISPADNYEVNNILMDIYYLSGYIIECAGSFGMLCLGKKITWTDKDGKERAIHNFQNNFIPTIENEYKNLNLDQLIDNSGVKDLYKEWKVEVRYKGKKLNEEDIRKFVTLSEDIYTSIKNITGN